MQGKLGTLGPRRGGSWRAPPSLDAGYQTGALDTIGRERRHLAVVRRAVLLIVVALGSLVLPPWAAAKGAALPPWGRVDLGAARSLFVRPHIPDSKPRRPASCEAGLEGGQGGGAPRVAIVGASITAGVGAGDPDKSWAVLLTRMERWDAVIYGDPGAGYVRPGVLHQGPVARELARVDLRALRPGLVIVQAGHNDIGEPSQLVRQRVAQAIALIEAEAPGARIALLTVFPGRSHAASVYQTDQTIVTAARNADPGVIIMDPLTGRWSYPRVGDKLHPTPKGDAQIAVKVAGILRAHGVIPAPAGRGGLFCDTAIGVRAPPQPR
jgi:lysophospholipase L1-like esterase